MCEGFCGGSGGAVVSVPSTPSNSQGVQLSPVDAMTNEAFLSAFFLPLAFFLLGLSKGIVLKMLRGI
uniref:Uncharacterized protein n=1 Tax=Dulem virus 55 TaxID=3145766 RepID=A0AAU8B2Y3_9VIRU